MNSNNWLGFPLSPTHSSLPSHHDLHESSNDHDSSIVHHHFSLGLVNDNNIDNPFQHHEWNLMDPHGGNEIPKVADFLGVSKLENQQDLVTYNNSLHANNDQSDYLFATNNFLQPVHGDAVPVALANYEFQENNANTLQSLTLSVGSGSKGSACETSGENSNSTAEAAPRRTLDTFGQRTSIYRGVTRHRWTGRYEAHLWDNSCRREGQSRKGRQVYLGGYDKEEKAARAYDMAALKYWGASTTTNFPITNYEKEMEDMKNMTRQEFVASIRRKSSGFSRGASMYRGVTRHHQHGRWQARIGRVAGNKDLYLGTFSTEEEAAEAYDIAAIKFRGLNAVTNFEMNRYDVKSILESNTLPIGGGAAKRLKEAHALETSRKREEMIGALGSSFQYGSSSSRLQPSLVTYPLLQNPTTFDHQAPLLSLQNPDMNMNMNMNMNAQYLGQDPTSQFYTQSYIQTQLQLHQQPSHDFYNTTHSSYLPNNPSYLHGLMSMESINNGSSSGSYSGGYLGNNNGNGMAVSGTSPGDDLSLVKVDYDMQPGGHGGWPSGADSGQGSNPNLFTMWNE